MGAAPCCHGRRSVIHRAAFASHQSLAYQAGALAVAWMVNVEERSPHVAHTEMKPRWQSIAATAESLCEGVSDLLRTSPHWLDMRPTAFQAVRGRVTAAITPCSTASASHSAPFCFACSQAAKVLSLPGQGSLPGNQDTGTLASGNIGKLQACQDSDKDDAQRACLATVWQSEDTLQMLTGAVASAAACRAHCVTELMSSGDDCRSRQIARNADHQRQGKLGQGPVEADQLLGLPHKRKALAVLCSQSLPRTLHACHADIGQASWKQGSVWPS